jgi:hypothetical protein
MTLIIRHIVTGIWFEKHITKTTKNKILQFKNGGIKLCYQYLKPEACPDYLMNF